MSTLMLNNYLWSREEVLFMLNMLQTRILWIIVTCKRSRKMVICRWIHHSINQSISVVMFHIMVRVNHLQVRLFSKIIVQNLKMVHSSARRDGQVWKTRTSRPTCMSHLTARTVIQRGTKVHRPTKMVRLQTWIIRRLTKDITDSTLRMCLFQIITYLAS